MLKNCMERKEINTQRTQIIPTHFFFLQKIDH